MKREISFRNEGSKNRIYYNLEDVAKEANWTKTKIEPNCLPSFKFDFSVKVQI